MIVLGISPSRQGGASVAIDDRLVAWSPVMAFEAVDGFPKGPAERALRLANVAAADVDLVVVAGRNTPRFLQKRPLLRRILEAPFSRALDATVALQALLRHSGVGAFEADAAAADLQTELVAAGYGQRRTISMDVHRALAEAAYRLQPADEALVITIHPQGDGSALAVHIGRAGQLDRLFVQGGFEALQTHLTRCGAALGLPADAGVAAFSALAGAAQPDEELLTALAERLHAVDGKLSRGVAQRADEPMLARLRAVDPAVGAASVWANLVATVRELVAWHIQRHQVGHVSLAGAIFDDPALVGALEGLPGLRRLTVLPSPGSHLAVLGAAASECGLSPHVADLSLGAGADEAVVERTLATSGLRAKAGLGLMVRIERGEAVARFRGRAAPDRLGLGARCVLVRPDDPAAIAAARAALRIPPTVRPPLLVRASPRPRWSGAELFGVCTLYGTASVLPALDLAAATAALLDARGRLVVQEILADRDPGLHRLLTMAASRGLPGLAALPFAESDGPQVEDPAHALEVWRRSGISAIQLGGSVLERDL